jgi:hypothetical protein
MEYFISKNKIIRNTLSLYLVLVIIAYLFVEIMQFSKDVFCFGVLYLTILYIPNIFITIDYFLRNKNSVFIRNDEGIYEYYDKNCKVSFSNSDIKVLEKHMTPNRNKNRFIYLFPWEHLFFIRLELKNGITIYLTCFLGNEIDKALKNQKHIYFRRILPTTRFKFGSQSSKFFDRLENFLEEE